MPASSSTIRTLRDMRGERSDDSSHRTGVVLYMMIFPSDTRTSPMKSAVVRSRLRPPAAPVLGDSPTMSTAGPPISPGNAALLPVTLAHVVVLRFLARQLQGGRYGPPNCRC